MEPILDCVFVETTTACSRRCKFCTHYYHEIVPEFMNEDLYLKVIDDLGMIGFSNRLSFYLNGEPLLDRRLERWLAIAKERCPEAFNFVNSNGDLLTRERAVELVDAGLDGMKVNAYSDNVARKVSEIKDRLPVTVSKKIHLSNRSQASDWSSRGGVVSVVKKRRIIYPEVLCPRPFRQLYVKVTGQVALCCTDDQCLHPMGDMNTQSVTEIWNGPEFSAIRQGFREKSEVASLCYGCDLDPGYSEVDQVRSLFS